MLKKNNITDKNNIIIKIIYMINNKIPLEIIIYMINN